MTDWESCYLEGHTPWDKGEPSPPLSAWIQNNRPTGRAVVPGCGVGHDVAALVAAGVDTVGVDISTTAIKMARTRYPQLAERFHLADLLELSAEWRGGFDYVFEHTCLCALPPDLRGAYAKVVHQLLKPGGLLVGVWFINPDMDPGETGPPFGIPLQELNALFAVPSWSVVEDFVPSVAFAGREGRERLRVLRKQS